MLRAASVVDWHDLFEAVWRAVAAGLGFCVSFSFAVLGALRAAEARERGDVAGTLPYGALGLVGIAATGAGVVLGLIAMARK